MQRLQGRLLAQAQQQNRYQPQQSYYHILKIREVGTLSQLPNHNGRLRLTTPRAS
jgi:hypothetical protein